MKRTQRRRRGPAAPIEEPGTATPRGHVPSTARDRRAGLVAVPLVLLVALAFAPAVGNEFVAWDDELNFLMNPDYRGLGWPQVRWAWTTFRAGVYQPIAWLAFEVQYVLCGLDPRGYHLTSLILHAAVAVALYALLVALLECVPLLGHPRARAVGAGLAAALFAAHPLRVEAVAWASCQPYLLCALFSLLAILAYLRAVGPGPSRWGWWAGSLLAFAAAGLSKAPAMALPAVLVLLDVYPLRRLGGGPGRWLGPPSRRVWLEKAPYAALGLAIAGLAVAARATVYQLAPLQREGLEPRLARACYAAWFYLVKSVVPKDIAAYYPPPSHVGWDAPPFLAGFLATLAVTAGLVATRRRWPGLLSAWLGYLILLAPGSGLVQIGSLFLADRYSYLPMMALAAPIAAGLAGAWAALRPSRAAAVGATATALAAILVLVLLTRGQCRVWRNSEVLWSHALEHGGPSAMAHWKLGVEYSGRGQIEEAEAHCREAVRLRPDFPQAQSELGIVLERRGAYAEAAAHYAEAIRLDPQRIDVQNNLAMILAAGPDPSLRDGRRAVALATRACELTGWREPACLDTLAAAHAEAGDFAAAVARQEQAIGLLPDGPIKEDYRARLALYRAGKPFRVTPPPAASRRAQAGVFPGRPLAIADGSGIFLGDLKGGDR